MTQPKLTQQKNTGELVEVFDMRLPCERCGELHIDEGVLAERAHHTHSCQYCGLTWRPAVVHTRGVRFLPGFKNETPPACEANWFVKGRP